MEEISQKIFDKYKESEHKVFIGIAGPPGSGKSNYKLLIQQQSQMN
jgi:pantothenate kinase-related protein Tda10